ncbi:hypothetical protein EPA93_22810 [Ktedonosporobacter rubrisoli]|uniref:CRISPR type III-associated protein domain-containing protein n=1 Tax=Ktedonosporobacter rubrisoli TaxID=2509675 RepID=A0A4P6JTL9_KTERU|nr:RAMP superfamily CRISPR-associated protein [Ktedonosporobacter rubrisoli]QBD78663.1 hypothetical protein EPA93_22810 [Ktedonosporobacter rubrisoli]
MNPYDFVRIDWSRPPERRRPAWHHRFTDAQGQQLYSGRLEVGVYAETPLFIIDPHSSSLDLRKPALSLQNRQGEYILPGSSLKGMLRCVVESLANGCLTLYAGRYERDKVHYEGKVQEEFRHCHSNAELCIACRLFGMLKEGARGVFLGKVNIGDACAYSDKVYLYDKPIYTLPLMEPKPHHASFYLDESGRYIAGRKYYFHHSRDKELLSENKIILMGADQPIAISAPLTMARSFILLSTLPGWRPTNFRP